MNHLLRSICFLVLVLAQTAAYASVSMEEAICPVCRVHEGEREAETVVATAEYDGQVYGFCSEKCHATFLEEPAFYLPPVFPRPAPSFVVRELGGEEFSSATLAGKVVLLDFWATWCPPCIDDLPKLSQLHERYSGAGLTVVSVSVDEGNRAARKVARMAKRLDAKHPIFLDTGGESAWASYLVRVVPSQFLIDQEGQIVAQWSGKSDLEEVEREILRLLGSESDPKAASL